MWFKATYLSPTEVGISNNDQHVTPSNSGNRFSVIFTAAVTVKTGTWPFQKIKAVQWYVAVLPNPLSPIDPIFSFDLLEINLKTSRPN